ncbi:hypothetical protein H9Q10_11505 [Eikenella sp. S3360]|uniref:Uncharacterized protein n=1 Tax=Eikenella glucosivorans TaxID=2766967 RepID=A0ABS0NDC3_9NEIS|nr:hypothetical protein [Eikenella glucosivorans]MBH5330288.1 hypothetical protein [Eikenella glucosivorans]
MRQFLLTILFALSSIAAAQSTTDPLAGQNGTKYIGTDTFGNQVYSNLAWYPFNEDSAIYTTNFIFVHAGNSDGKIASISIPTILDTEEAGFNIVEATTLMEMSENNKNGLNQIYIVNCHTQQITDESGRSFQLNNMQGVHRTAANIACAIRRQGVTAKHQGLLSLIRQLTNGWNFQQILH